MKGLLLQDIYIMKKNLIISGGLCIYFFAILLLGSTNSSYSEIDISLYILCGIIPCFLTSCACFTISPGKTSKNSLFIYACPLPNPVITMEKYVITYTLHLTGYAVIFFFFILNHFICGYIPGKNTFFICFIIFSILLLFTNIELPITMRFGQAVASAILIGFICLIIIIGLAMVIKINISPNLYKNFTSFFKHKTYISLILFLADILSSVLSYQTARHINRI